MPNPKTHAKDYLLEFLSSRWDKIPDWVHILIYKVIENDWILSKEEKDSMFIDFIKSRWVNISDILDPTEEWTPIDYTESYTPKEKRNILLERLTHVKWVNALIENESIVFSQNCTILFGMNGSGKSGYFKVLNEVVWWGNKKEILWNIHTPWNGNKEVIIEYSNDWISESPVSWKGDSDRWIFPEITVFDSQYLEKYIWARKSGIDPQPLWLHYFSVITKTIEDYGIFLDNSIITLSKPDLSGIIVLIQSEELKRLLGIQTKPDSISYEKIDALKEFWEDMIEQLKQKWDILDKIKSSDAHIKLNETRIKSLNDFLKTISRYDLCFKLKYWKLHFAIKQFKEVKEKQRIMQKSLDILKTVPNEWMGSWEDFIKSADKYKKECTQNHYDLGENTCPYCHQEITNPDSSLLLQAYTKYLDDTSTKNVQEKWKFLKKTIAEIQEIQIAGLTEIPESEKIKQENPSFYKTLTQINDHFIVLKKEIISNYTEWKEINITSMVSFKRECIYLEATLSIINKEQGEFIKIIEKKEEIQNEVSNLNDRKIFSVNHSTIRSYYDFLAKKHKLEDTKKETSGSLRAQISSISAVTSEELGTSLVNITLKEELASLHSGLDISLAKVSNIWWVVELKPQILGFDAVKILSEWELKALGLAILLTNIIHQDSPWIILDDPVNSMDHKLQKNFAKRITELSKQTQVIIFTHNITFLTYLETEISKNKDLITNTKYFHICGNPSGCSNTASKHVFSYQVDKISQSSTGRIKSKWMLCCSYYLQQAEKGIRDSEDLDRICFSVKKWIEYFIDEKILNKLTPIALTPDSWHIEWTQLKGVWVNDEVIDTINSYYSELSSRGTHLSSSESENPITIPELTTMITYLKSNLTA